MIFEDIYSTFYPRVYRLCMGYTADEDKAKDLAQEIFIAVWKHLPGFRNEAAVGTWVYRIATNHCLRATAKEQRIISELPLQMSEAPVPDTEEKLQLLYKCIASLKEADRIIISLVLEGLPQAEIAHIAGLSEGNVRVKIHRIKELLTQKIKSYGHF